MKPSKDARRSRREMCSDFVQVAWNNQQGKQCSDIGLIEDVTPEGLCLNLGVPLPVSSLVRLHTKGFEGEGEVRYCRPSETGGHLVGLEFVNGSEWDRAKWRPKHLLTLP